ncbi:uncharacterized protein [Lolium perenne]|uniref:uncharacterized protein n=3 Tax=Lolium perenne TaxID=4522 RepID=UPI003A99268D
MADGTFVRDEEGEEAVQKLIYESARGADGDETDFADFLNDFGEGLESEQVRRDNEVSITNSAEPSGTSSKSVKTKRGPTRVLKGEGRLALTAFKDNGEPVHPKDHCTKFTSQAGVLVRDHVPISIREWHKPKKADNEASYVNDAMKKFLWETLLTRFSLPEDMTEGQKNKVKEWTLKKMAIQFQTWKKNLWDKYKNEDPVFDDNLVKIKDHWQEFKRYKQSSTFVSRSVTNKKNAAKKTIWHHMGSGGYKTAIPRWIAYENELMAAGITPQTWDWPERSKFWLFAHGAGLDPKTGLIVAEGKWKEKIEQIVPKLVAAIEQVRKGEYIPDRENDELTLALGNPEHVGRVRARPGLTMKEAFPESADTYRSRSRKKKKDADIVTELLTRVEALEKNQRPPDQPMFLQDPQADAAPSQRRSSVGSTHLDGCGGSYPVDYVTEKTDCELYMLFRTASVKVAVGYVYPSEEGATHHHMPIPPGCVRVGVDEVVPAFESVELDIPRGDDERTLADVKHGFALWPKKYVVLLQRPPTPHSSPHEHQRPSTPPPSSPHDPPPRDPPRKTAPGKRNGTPPKKRSRKEKPLPPIEKLPWEKTPEENQEAVESQRRAFFAKKEPEIPFEKTLDPVKVYRTVENLYNPEPSPPSDYRRSIERSYDQMMEAKNPTTSSGIREIKGIHQVYQLGEQPVKSVPPLKVFDEKAVQSSRQISTDYAMAKVVYQYVQGKDLVENLSKLPTSMRNLHTWYGVAAKGGMETIMVRVKEEHYFQEYSVSVDFSELFQLYNLRALDKSIVSCYCLLKMLECKRDEIKDIGFIDPDTMHVKTIEEPLYNRDTPETLLRFLKRQRDKKTILWPYNFQFHFILIVIKMYEGEVEVFDSLTKEPIQYKSCFLMLKSVWETFIKEDQSHDWKPKLIWRANKKCAKQPPGTNLCGYYVCEYIHRIVSERANNERNRELRRKREKIGIEERFKAIGDELAGFFLREVIPPSGEYHYA